MKNWNFSRDQILKVQIPENTDSYTAIPHSVFLEELENEITKSGYTIAQERFLTTKEAQVLTGCLTLNSALGEEIAPTVYFVNSYNKMRRAYIKVGATVLVCTNGMISESVKSSFSRKHSGEALEDIRAYIKDVVLTIKEEMNSLETAIKQMKSIVLGPDKVANLLGEMFIYKNIITPTQLSTVKKEVNRKGYKTITLWEFYNCCTESFKDSHPMFFDKQHVKFHSFISDSFDLETATGVYEKKEEEFMVAEVIDDSVVAAREEEQEEVFVASEQDFTQDEQEVISSQIDESIENTLHEDEDVQPNAVNEEEVN